MKGNAEKCDLVQGTNESVDFQLGDLLIERSDCEKMLGVSIDYKLILTNMRQAHVINKLTALARTTPYMRVE